MSQDKVEAGSVAVPINDPEALMEAVRKQIEYYFSKENLQNDKYLNSLMDSNQSVAISEILKFGKIKSLTQDEGIIRSSLVKSSLVVIADDRIKSSAKSVRSTVILREIPSSVSEDEVRAIFAYDNCKPIISVRSDVGDTWFVVFDSEEDAKDTLLDLKMKKRCFQGQPVKCRLKTETTVPRTYFPGPSVSIPVGSGSGAGSPNSLPSTSPMFPNGPQMPYIPGMMMTHGAIPPPFPIMAPLMPMGGSIPIPPAAVNVNPPKPPSDANANATVTGSGGNRSNNRGKGSGKGGAGKGKSAEGHAQKPAGNKKQIEMNASNFPTLEFSPNSSPTQSGAAVSASAAGIKGVGLKFLEAIPIATPGYKGPYKSYTYDEIIAIVKTVQEANLPNEVTEYVKNLPSSSAVFSDSPNLDLLLRQRTFSIDETREQLQQGRPVQREALLSGGIENTVNYGTSAKKGSGSFSYASVVKTAAAPEEPAAVVAAPPKPAAAPKQTSNAKGSSQGKASANESKPKEGKEKKKKDRNAHADKEGVAAAGGDVAALSLEDKDASAWGGKPSFANVLKLAASTATATPPSPPRAAPKQEESSGRQGNRNRSGSGSNREQFKKSNDSEKASAMTSGSWRRGAKPESDK